jgi:hypothetical protein
MSKISGEEIDKEIDKINEINQSKEEDWLDEFIKIGRAHV